MTYRQRRRDSRSAFTLIELMVVITIIAILVALLTTAVMSAINKGPELQTSSEIGQFQSKLSSAAQDANVKYLPSRLHLSKQNFYPNKATPGTLDFDSVAFLQQRFGRHACFDFTPLSGANMIDWNGGGPGTEKQELYLEGEQCMVFHLGGVVLQAGGSVTMVGFSLNPSNPAAAVVTGQHRNGPFYEFQSNRLKMVQSAFTDPVAFPVQLAGGSYGQFPEYLDPWVQVGGVRSPYAYFVSSLTEGNGQYDKYGTSDCPSLVALTTGSALVPYVSPNGVPFNPSSCQIISAGKDGKFGGGGALPRAGTTDPYGKDDQSNFSAHLLGTAP